MREHNLYLSAPWIVLLGHLQERAEAASTSLDESNARNQAVSHQLANRYTHTSGSFSPCEHALAVPLPMRVLEQLLMAKAYMKQHIRIRHFLVLRSKPFQYSQPRVDNIGSILIRPLQHTRGRVRDRQGRLTLGSNDPVARTLVGTVPRTPGNRTCCRASRPNWKTAACNSTSIRASHVSAPYLRYPHRWI
jgi:hypothetical protein